MNSQPEPTVDDLLSRCSYPQAAATIVPDRPPVIKAQAAIRVPPSMADSQPKPKWQPGHRQISLAANEIHLWRILLTSPDLSLHDHWSILNKEERRRAQQYRFEKDQLSYTIRRGSLRFILSHYLAVKPDDISFQNNQFGRPELAAKQNIENLTFSLSSSSEIALCALTRRRKIGVDIERMRANIAYEALAKRFFALEETAALAALPSHVRRQAFFRIWVQKEAYLKGIGTGLATPLSSFAVNLSSAGLIRSELDENAPEKWVLRELVVDPAYAAAVAVAGHGWWLKYRHY